MARFSLSPLGSQEKNKKCKHYIFKNWDNEGYQLHSPFMYLEKT